MSTMPPASSGWIKKMQLGQKYMKTWPTEKQLAPMFPENRIIKATRFGIQFMPPLAIFTLTWQIALGGQLGPAIATALFACSLPMQGLWWLGKRASTPLPVALLKWFHEIRDKFAKAGIAMAPVQQTPTYQSLAEILKRAFKQLDRSFLDDI
ncbi:terminus macrodomain insulation protein YfbV [Photorhabdus asymbiotica]|uniref:terminus macrodomain insulation protein YfbV n=1 Tax=Photorhabdus asymbiotica TaxID=291112 RepID=UPI003DA72942